MRRRSLLSIAASLVVASAAGCTAIERYVGDYRVSVFNGDVSPRRIHVRITNDSQDVALERTFEKDGETGDEDLDLDGVPSRVYVAVDDEIEHETAWPTDDGDRAEAAAVWYDPYRAEDPIYVDGHIW